MISVYLGYNPKRKSGNQLYYPGSMTGLNLIHQEANP